VPGFLEGVESEAAVIVPLLVTIEDEDLHRSHFYRRGRETVLRPQERYLNAFKKIRKIQKYMINSALMREVPTVEHYDLDTTLSRIIDEIIPKALQTVGRGGHVASSDERLLERAVEAIGRQKEEGSTEHEIVS
jgi:2-phosphoglycerate kinase